MFIRYTHYNFRSFKHELYLNCILIYFHPLFNKCFAPFAQYTTEHTPSNGWWKYVRHFFLIFKTVHPGQATTTGLPCALISYIHENNDRWIASGNSGRLTHRRIKIYISYNVPIQEKLALFYRNFFLGLIYI